VAVWRFSSLAVNKAGREDYIIALLVLATGSRSFGSISQKLRTELANSSRLQHLFLCTGDHKLHWSFANSGSFRFLRPETAGLITPYALRRWAERLAGAARVYAAFFVSL